MGILPISYDSIAILLQRRRNPSIPKHRLNLVSH